MFDKSVLSLAVSRDGATLAVALQSGGGVVFWNRQSDGSYVQIAADRDFGDRDATALAVDDEGRFYATSYQGSVKRYKVPYTGKPEVFNTRTGKLPNAIAIPEAGTPIAVSFADHNAVDLYDGRQFEFQKSFKDNDGDGRSFVVGWSRDGSRLYAGGTWPRDANAKIRVWSQPAGRKLAEDANGPGNSVTAMTSCIDGVVVTSAAPGLGRLSRDGRRLTLWKNRVTVDMRGKRFGDFKVSAEGTRVRFGLKLAKAKGDLLESELPVLFDAMAETLANSPQAPADVLDADTDPAHVPVTDWHGAENTVKLGGQPIALDYDEETHAAAIAPDSSSFVIGTDYHLRGYRRDGTEAWPPQQILSYTWGLNITRNGKFIVAAHGDGTIRWYRLADGVELLALFVDARDRRWVAWTPKGYYMASAGGEKLIGFRLDRGPKKTESFGRVQSFRTQFLRPDIVKQVLVDVDEPTALRNSDTRIATKPRALSQNAMASARIPVSQAPDIATLAARRTQPVVKINQPIENSENPGGEIFVNYTVESKLGLRQVKITVNGVVASNRYLGLGATPEGGLPIWEKVTLPPGKATIEIVAASVDATEEGRAAVPVEAEVRSEPAVVHLSWPETKPEPPLQQRPLYALLIGVGKYDEKFKDTVPSLTGPPKDVDAFEAVLRAQLGNGKPFREIPGGIRKLIDPKKGEIDTALSKLRAKSGVPDAFVLIYYSGHGLSESNTAFLLPSDYQGDPWSEAVEAEKLLKMFKDKAGSVVLFLDACQSGMILGAGRQQFGAGGVVNDAEQGSIVAYAASLGEQPAIGGPTKSLFTEVVVDGLKGKAANAGKKRITAFNLAAYVRQEVQDRSANRQTPVVSLSSNESRGPLDLVLARID